MPTGYKHSQMVCIRDIKFRLEQKIFSNEVRQHHTQPEHALLVYTFFSMTVHVLPSIYVSPATVQ